MSAQRIRSSKPRSKMVATEFACCIAGRFCCSISHLKCQLVHCADQQQIEHVTSKVSMVDTMHDGLRLAMAALRQDVQDGKVI